jgi:hypothetical protein
MQTVLRLLVQGRNASRSSIVSGSSINIWHVASSGWESSDLITHVLWLALCLVISKVLLSTRRWARVLPPPFHFLRDYSAKRN